MEVRGQLPGSSSCYLLCKGIHRLQSRSRGIEKGPNLFPLPGVESFVGLPDDSLFTTPTELSRLHIFVQSEKVSRQIFLLNIATACDMMLTCTDAPAKRLVVLPIICKGNSVS
jgi:hypothetical protein